MSNITMKLGDYIKQKERSNKSFNNQQFIGMFEEISQKKFSKMLFTRR